jgi:hypothetical protein
VLLAAGVAFLRWVQTSPEPGVPDSIAYEAEEARLQAATAGATPTKADAREDVPASDETSKVDAAKGESSTPEEAPDDRRPKKKKRG